MAIHKRKTKSGIRWAYYFNAPGATRQDRKTLTGGGFDTKQKAVDAEATRRLEAQAQWEAEQRGVTEEIPKTLRELIAEFFTEHAERELGAKTVDRYRDHAAILSPALLDTLLPDLTALHMTREWARLSREGGHYRRTKAARPLSAKTVRNVAGFVSSVFAKAMEWGAVNSNPVTASAKPKGAARDPVAFNPEQARQFIGAAVHRVVGDILEIAAATGARRGEVLALRWQDIQDDQAVIYRSMSQVGSKVFIKVTKTPAGKRIIALPSSALELLEQLRRSQQVYRDAFGANYRTDLDLIFCELNGEPLRPNSISASVSAIRRRLGLPKGASLHAFRHSHVSQLIAAGVDLPTISGRVGHASVATTLKIYAHLLKGRDSKAAEMWEQFQQGGAVGKDPLPTEGRPN